MLNHQFNPKLSLAEEKVDNLKNIVDQKKQERESLEQLIILNRHIEKYKMTKYQLQKRSLETDEKIQELKKKCEESSKDIREINEQLLSLNKKNLKETYVLEDLQEDLDRLKAQRERDRQGLTFMTENDKQKNELPPQLINLQHQESYATLEK